MKTKIIVICVGMLLLATAVPAVTSLNTHGIFPMASRDVPQKLSRDDWTETQKLLASDGEANDQFGLSVAVEGDTALIGAMKDSDNGQYAGSTYVFTYTGTTWTLQQKLLATNGQPNDLFGYSVSLSGDTALIGAAGANAGQGAAYVFVRTGTTWTEQAKLTASDGADYDEFGVSVSVSANTALVGAYGHNSNTGAAYVFLRTGTSWAQQAELVAPDGATNDQFGLSVALSGDTALIGARWDDDNQDASGSAYVFTRAGTTWSEQAKLLPSDGAAYDAFGSAVSLSGETALIGAPKDDMATMPGSAYIFTRSGTSWEQQAKLVASDGVAPDFFGCAVSVDEDTAVVGAFWGDGVQTDSGSAYVFIRTGTSWEQQAKLVASDGEGYDDFGYAVSISGVYALVGAFEDDGAKGSTYVYTKESEPEPPTPPVISGPSSGKAKLSYNYTFVSTDIDNDDVSYFIDWGDNTTTGWVGPYAAGEPIIQSHSWATKGTYLIKAKAKNTHGDESAWGTMSVSMPCVYQHSFQTFWDRIFERFPLLFPVLRFILGV